MIDVSHLTIAFGHRVLLDDVSASIPQKSLTAFIGRNGTGKSTLLRAIAGLNSHYTGNITLPAEQPLARTLAFVTTERIRVEHLTASEVVALGRAPYTGWAGRLSEEDQQIVAKALKDVGIDHMAAQNVVKMSDGELQRVMIARALAQQTPIILLDEPTSFLDLPSRWEVCRLLQRLAREKGKTIVYSTHELDIALALADHIMLISPPQLITLPTEEMKKSGLIEKTFHV